MQHKGMAIKYLCVHLSPGARNNLCNCLLMKAANLCSEGWKSCQVKRGRMTVKGKGHLLAQAASVLRADKGAGFFAGSLPERVFLNSGK